MLSTHAQNTSRCSSSPHGKTGQGPLRPHGRRCYAPCGVCLLPVRQLVSSPHGETGQVDSAQPCGLAKDYGPCGVCLLFVLARSLAHSLARPPAPRARPVSARRRRTPPRPRAPPPRPRAPPPVAERGMLSITLLKNLEPGSSVIVMALLTEMVVEGVVRWRASSSRTASPPPACDAVANFCCTRC